MFFVHVHLIYLLTQVALLAIAVIGGAGFALYTKFKSWEKKHIL
jgi:hypothetical protein